MNDILNPVISEDDAIAMLAEHLVTLPVFTAIFNNEDFVSKNNITRIMSNMLSKLAEAGLDQETAKLRDYYDSVKETVSGITDSAQRQSLVKKIYETFFQYALPRAQEKFGIVYTPNEIVDFIINSVEHVLQSEFNESLANPGIKILDPFTGTGTFIVRLLDFIHNQGVEIDKLEHKYTNDIWCNEIMLLAYYIALINIEATFGAYKNAFLPFEHAVFTDTFQMAERRINKVMQVSSYSDEYQDFKPAFEKQKEEDTSDIRVIIANPPYSVGQKNANDNNKNDPYENLDNRIRSTYLKDVKVNNVNSVFDSYVRSFRWASDRITENGILAYVTNGSFIDNLAFSGFRKSLLDEFQNVYVFNLRGNARTQGELRRKEKDSVFGQGTRTTICITILVKHKGKANDGFVHYHDIGDYLDREKKLAIIKGYGDISAINWNKIYPDKSSDWLNKKNDKFSEFLLIGDKKSDETTIFSDHYSAGTKTGKDAWVYDFDLNTLKVKISAYFEVYKGEQDRLRAVILSNGKLEEKSATLNDSVTKDKRLIKWDRELLNKLSANASLNINDVIWRPALYRPFTKVHMAHYPKIIQMNYLWSSIFPEEDSTNIVIGISAPPLKQGFSAIISNALMDLHVFEQAQIFPLYWYEEMKQDGQLNLFSNEDAHHKYEKKYAITDETLMMFREQYEDMSITKEDIFYYIYGVFHSPTYKTIYKTNLSKEFPRIPFLTDFKGYSSIGKNLAEIHLHYDIESPYTGVKIVQTKADYCVDKIRFLSKERKDTIIFNDWIRIENIPDKAYEYVVNGRSPIEWVLDQYQVSTDSESDIVSDPNKYAKSGGKYVYDLLLSLISTSLKTVNLVSNLPKYEEM